MSIAVLRRWSRSSSARFALLFLLLFGSTSGALFAFVYWRSIAYFNAQTDDWLARESARAATPEVTRAALIKRVDTHNQHDLAHLRSFALFDSHDRRLAGPLERPPSGLPRAVPIELDATTNWGRARLRLMTRATPQGDVFVASQDLRQTRAFAAELTKAMLGTGVVTLLLGLAGSFALAAARERRVRALGQQLHQIMAGRLEARLPLSDRRDEIDDLATEVNQTLSELQRLMIEVKSAGDNIAHDLRTPLTRLLMLLQRANTPGVAADDLARVVGDAVDEVQAMIAMFNALLRIAEIDEGARRTGFRAIDLAQVVTDVAEFHEVAAIERGIVIERVLPDCLAFEGDADLLFEAVSNLLDNAIKYTPDGGRIDVRLDPGPVLSVADSGPGIPPEERHRVVQRFHRVETSRHLPGNGLGLALVGAVARLHRLELCLGGSRGCVATLAAKA